MKLDRIHFGDCFDLMPSIETDSIDLVLSDPPYVRSLSDLAPALNGQLIDWKVLSDQFYHILKPNGQLAMFADLLTATVMINSFDKHFRYRYHWVWQKPNGNPVNKKQPLVEVELMLVWCKKEANTKDLIFNHEAISTPSKPYNKQTIHQYITRKSHKQYTTENSSGRRYPKQVIRFPSKCNLTKEERKIAKPFPCYKPVALCSYLVKALSNPGDIVLDPFSGSGSIGVACKKLGRKFIAIEKDPDYFQKSVDRLEAEQKRLCLL